MSTFGWRKDPGQAPNKTLTIETYPFVCRLRVWNKYFGWTWQSSVGDVEVGSGTARDEAEAETLAADAVRAHLTRCHDALDAAVASSKESGGIGQMHSPGGRVP